MLLYVILSGCSPFSADEEEAILELVATAKFEFHETEWSGVSVRGVGSNARVEGGREKESGALRGHSAVAMADGAPIPSQANAKDLISKLLVVEPEKRLTMAGMLDHPWLRDAVAAGRQSVSAAVAARQQQRVLQPKVQGRRAPGIAQSCCTIS